MFPKVSPFLSDRPTLAKTEMKDIGVIAFVREDKEFDLRVDVDVKHLSTGKKYRVDFDPKFFNYMMFYINSSQVTSLDRKWRRDVISDSVAFFALPEGEYVPVFSVYKVSQMERLMAGDTRLDMLGFKSVGQRFRVEGGKVTSFGRVRVDFNRGFFKKTVLNVYSTGVSISDDIRAVHEIEASQWEISEQEFRATLK